MRKLLFMGAIAAAALCLLPERSQAQGFGFGYGYGQRTAPLPFGFLGRVATHHMQWIHMDGPLYNYGPYYTPGHVTMHIPKPYHGAYVPGDYTLWNNGYYGGYPAQGGYPVQGGYYPAQTPVAPQTSPPPVGQQPAPAKIISLPTTGDVIPAAVLPPARSPVLATPYHPIYPAWLTNR